MSGYILHLAAPMQSWGTPAYFGDRPTQGHPTRSALIGMIACTLGRARRSSNQDLAGLRFTIRVDAPGMREVDFHSVGGGHPRELTPPTADGKRRKAGEGTILTERAYLAGAAFTVAVNTHDDALTKKLVHAWLHPVFHPYLGRKAFPAAGATVVKRFSQDPDGELRRVPLHRKVSTFRADPGTLFISEIPAPSSSAQVAPATTQTREHLDVPSAMGNEYLRALYRYREEGE